MSEENVAQAGRHIKDVGVVDLRYAKSIEDLADIKSISDVGVILFPEELIGAIGRIDIHDVGGIVPVPAGGKVNCLTGQTRLTGESLQTGDSDTTLILVGQTFITTPVVSVGYKEIRVVGQLFAIRGSESALSAKITSLTGQNFYLPQDPRFIMGEETFTQEFLELLPDGTTFVIMGNVHFAADVTRDMLLKKLSEIVLMGVINAPSNLVPALQVITKDKMGEIKSNDA